MTDFSIQHQQIQNETTSFKGRHNEFLKLKKEYDKAQKRIKGSDFANSPAALETELGQVKKLIAAAKKQGLDGEVKALEEREQEIYTKLANSSVSLDSTPYYKPIISHQLFGVSPDDFEEEEEEATFGPNFKSERYTAFFEQNFDNVDAIKNGITELYNAGINQDVIIKILKSLKTTDINTHSCHIDPGAMHYIAQMKNTLVNTQKNESNENKSPITHLNELIVSGENLKGDNITFIWRDGELVYSTPIEGEHPEQNAVEYQKAVQREEDELLYKFVDKYKTKNGENKGKIDSKYIRTFSALRQYGITRNCLMDLIDSCIKEDGSIDKEMLSTIGELKKAGVLSKDIKELANNARNPETGEFDRQYIDTAKALTASVMKGKDVAGFLKDAKGGEEAQEFLVEMAPRFDTESLGKLVKLVKDKDGNMNENAMDIVNALFGNDSIFDETGHIKTNELINMASVVVTAVKNASSPEGTFNEDATAMIFQLCHNAMPVEDIIDIFDNCLDENRKINSNLSKIAWHMAWDEESPDNIIEMLKNCFEHGKVAEDLARDTLRLFDD